jgi:type IV secretory pathway VirB3-like protein
MEGPGYSLWLIIILVALLFVVLWGILVAFLAFGTWMVVRLMPKDDRHDRGRDLDP